MTLTQELTLTLRVVNRKLFQLNKPALVLRSAYGKKGVSQAVSCRDVSPSLTMRQLVLWLEAFDTCLDYTQREG
jgi:hypothetical protein